MEEGTRNVIFLAGTTTRNPELMRNSSRSAIAYFLLPTHPRRTPLIAVFHILPGTANHGQLCPQLKHMKEGGWFVGQMTSGDPTGVGHVEILSLHLDSGSTTFTPLGCI